MSNFYCSFSYLRANQTLQFKTVGNELDPEKVINNQTNDPIDKAMTPLFIKRLNHSVATKNIPIERIICRVEVPMKDGYWTKTSKRNRARCSSSK